ncbi:hypothetical protein [Rhodococcus aetherivorans]|uniref:hypothetical protein n=1 Tax=Rhodococcus aetherivorans TaxID=191292 RepID=UPI003890D7D3
MERTTRKRYTKAEVPQHLQNATAADTLEQILKMPGEMDDTYNRYKIRLSLGNMALLATQGLHEFGNTLPRWNDDFHRSVIMGEKAYYIRRPAFKKELNEETGEYEEKLVGFPFVKCWFGVNQTEGEEMPPHQSPEYSIPQLLETYGIEEEPFRHENGNCQGYSYSNRIAVNPIAKWPDKTRLHETAHVLAGHTVPEFNETYQDRMHRGRAEWVVDTAAHIALKMAGLTHLMNESASRYYTENWRQGQDIPDEDCKQAISIGEKLLKGMRVSAANVPIIGEASNQTAVAGGGEGR